MIIISEDNLLARVIVAVRLKILGHCEGGQGGKEGRKDFSVEYFSPQKNLKSIFLFHSYFRICHSPCSFPPHQRYLWGLLDY